MINEKAVEYIKKLLEIGTPEEIIKSNLAISGFDFQTINDSFKQALPSTGVIPSPSINNPFRQAVPSARIIPSPLKKGVTKEIKKSYSPFKMWGAWIGGIIGFLSYLFGVFFINAPKDNFDFTVRISIAMYVIMPILIGFFLGWGIHSLIRKFRK